MVIRKQYNIGQLVEQIQTEIEKSIGHNGVAKLDVLTANDILEVLKEIQKMEQGNQNLESEPTSIEKEEGTQTNITEECDKKYCFGCYVGNDIECCMCMCGDECLKETKRIISKTKKGKTNE